MTLNSLPGGGGYEDCSWGSSLNVSIRLVVLNVYYPSVSLYRPQEGFQCVDCRPGL